MTPPLQFGDRHAHLTYEDRRAVFGVAVRAGKVALARITRGDDHYFDLPGGALDPGETEEAALVREFAEETGLAVQVDDLLARANQYLVKSDGRALNNRGAFYLVTVVGDDPAGKSEDDHELVWADPVEALGNLRHGAHGFAVAAWLKVVRDEAAYAAGASTARDGRKGRSGRAAARA